MKDLLETLAIIVVGVLIVAAIASIGSRHAFATLVVYSAAGIITCSLAMTASVVGIGAAAGALRGGGEKT